MLSCHNLKSCAKALHLSSACIVASSCWVASPGTGLLVFTARCRVKSYDCTAEKKLSASLPSCLSAFTAYVPSALQTTRVQAQQSALLAEVCMSEEARMIDRLVFEGIAAV